MDNQNKENQVVQKKQNRFVEVWKRLVKSPFAVAGMIILGLMLLLAASSNFIAPAGDGMPGYNQQRRGPANTRQMPSIERAFNTPEGEGFFENFSRHIMGTDDVGRGVFARIAHGAQISLSVAIVVILIGLSVGGTIGAIAGYYSGVVDNVFMRLIDILLALPNILLAIAIIGAIGSGLMPVMVAVGIGAIPLYARTVRAQVIINKEQEFVEAAHASGASNFRIVTRHILPNCMSPVIVEASMGMAGAILAAAGLSFIGLGLQPPQPEWGAMLSAGRGDLLAGYWHLTLFPGLMIALIIFAFNMIGDGLRDALDPKLRSGSISKRKFLRLQKARAEQMMHDLREGEV